MISIIIPTLNEEKLLPRLLKSIKKQGSVEYEIIVADANSSDRTVEIARKYGCKIVPGGKPAVGRNNGAKVAKGDYLLFLDADVVLPDNFLKEIIETCEEKNIDIATCKISPISKKKIDIALHSIYNFYSLLTQYFYPHAPGFCILVRKDLFNKVGGFNEMLKLAEDHDFVKRAGKKGKFRVLSSAKILVSTRRLEKDGRIATSIKYCLCEIYRFICGEIKTDIFNYEFSHYNKEKTSKKLLPSLINKECLKKEFEKKISDFLEKKISFRK